jgi:uncharacterized protein (TIGR02996 family)
LTERELLAAIGAAPDDDAPKLVYADWLIDRGDARGEHIRLMIAGHDAEAAALRDAHPSWTSGLPARVRHAKGFVVEATLDAETRDWPALLARHPLLRAARGSIHALSLFPRDRLVWAGIDDWIGPGVDALPFGQLVELEIFAIDRREMNELAGADWPALRSFTAGRGTLYRRRPMVGSVIAGALWYPSLERLALCGEVDASAARELAARGAALRELDLTSCWLEGRAPVEWLARIPRLERLALAELSGDALELLVPRLGALRVDEGRLTDEAVKRIATLHEVELRGPLTLAQARMLRAAGHRAEPRYVLEEAEPVPEARDRLERAMRRWGTIFEISMDTWNFPHDGFSALARAVAAASGERLGGEGWPAIGRAVWPEIADKLVASPPAPAELLGRRFGELEDPFTPLLEILAARDW